MYNYSNNNTALKRDDDSAPLLSSSLHNSINYSSIHRQSIDYASLISAAVDEGDLHEQDNESIRRTQRSSSIASLQQQSQPQKNSSGSGSNNSEPVANKPIFSHSYWQSIFDRYSTSLYLENKGSVARDHLGNHVMM